jgi:hypothetical protein
MKIKKNYNKTKNARNNKRKNAKSMKIKKKYNKTKNARSNKTKNARSNKKKNIIGGELKYKCSSNSENFPKCGKEGCVYLDNDTSVTKKQWKTYQEIPSYFLSIEGQDSSKNYAPNIISHNIKPCDLINIIGKENTAPCFVKRHRNTKSGEKILYEEEQRPSWCRNYGIKNQCIVDDNMYNNLKNNVAKVSLQGKPSKNIKLPEVDDFLDGDASSIDDEDLGDLHGEIDIDESFTNLNPIFLTNTKMNRIKGITIAELIEQMYTSLGPEKTMAVSKEWEDEKENLLQQVSSIGYTSPDFNEQNIMIDVDNEGLCSWIDSMLLEGEPITPEKIKHQFGKEDILKIVDWGLLRKSKIGK